MSSIKIELVDAKAVALDFAKLKENLTGSSGAVSLCNSAKDIEATAWAGRARTAFNNKCFDIIAKINAISEEAEKQRQALIDTVVAYSEADTGAASLISAEFDNSKPSSTTFWNSAQQGGE